MKLVFTQTNIQYNCKVLRCKSLIGRIVGGGEGNSEDSDEFTTLVLFGLFVRTGTQIRKIPGEQVLCRSHCARRIPCPE